MEVPHQPNWEQLWPSAHLVLATAPQVPSLLSGTEAEDVGAGVAAAVGFGVVDGVGVELQTPNSAWHPPPQKAALVPQ